MNPELIDALINIFSNFSQTEQSEYLVTTSESIHEILEQSGFNASEINDAISWLEAFSIGNDDQQIFQAQRESSFRILSNEEYKFLSKDAIVFLTRKSNNNELSKDQLEFILNQAYLIGKEEISLEKITWIYYMTRLNFPYQEINDSDENEKDRFSELPYYYNDNFLHNIH